MHHPVKPRQALESLGREIDRLEADILDPALSSAATDPAKACSRLEAYRHRLSELQVRNSTAGRKLIRLLNISGLMSGLYVSV